MVTRSEEILLTLNGKDNASQMFSNVDSNAKSMAASINSALSSINNGMLNLGAVTDNLMQGLTGKSALDNIFGTTSKAETNSVLLKNMLDDAEKNYDSFYKKVDETTDASLTSMQELIPALKAFKSATGATDKEMTNVTDEIANFGAAVLAQTGSTDLAQQSMMDLSKGIKGAFASLDQYGITEAALKRTGYWNGDEKDVEGFMKAVDKVTGSTEELMQTNTGLDALIGKSFSRAGKKIGNEFLPFIKDIKRGFIDLDNELGGSLAASMLVVSGGIETANTAFWNISTTVNGIRDLSDAFSTLTSMIKGAGDAAETTGDSINAISNASDIGSGLAGAAGAAGAGADFAKGASKSMGGASNIALEGLGSFSAIDLIVDSRKEQKAAAEAEKEIDKLINRKENLLKNIVDTDDEKLIGKLKKGVASADAKLTTGSLSDEAIGGLLQFQESSLEKLNHEGDGLSDAIRDSFSKQGTKITDAAEQGGESLQKGLKKMADVPSKLTTSFSSFTESFSNSIHDFKDDGVKGNLKKLDQKLLGVFKSTDEISGALNAVDDMGDIGKTVSGAENIAEGMGGLATAAGTVESTAPALNAGATGVEAAAAGSAGLAASFTSMIVPLLAISAVIIIMIPIVAVIAAEALIFIRLLADFMQALNFDGVNLDGAINGISQVATALAWVGVAMAAMSFASIMTGLSVITGGFLGILGPLDIAVDAIKKASEKLSTFNNVEINENVANNIQSISMALGAVASAMGALTWTNITTGFSNFIAGALGFGSVTDGLEQAKNDIIEASHKLQEFSSLTPLDEGVANNIQNVCDSLASVGDAIGALRSIRDGQNWDNLIGDLMSGLFGDGLDIGQALDKVKGDIENAATALSGWNSLQEIPEGLGDKIKKVSDALTSISEAFQTLRGFRDDGIWDDMIGGIFQETDIATALDNVMNDISTASEKLSGLNIAENINDDLIKKIQHVVSALTEVTNVANQLTTLPPMENFNSENITTVIDNVKKASEALAGLNVGEVNEDVITTIKNVAGAMTEISGVMTTLTALPPMEGFDPSQITTAVTNVQTIANELSSLAGITVGEDVTNILGTINTALETLKETLNNASGFNESGVNIGAQIVSGVGTGLQPLSSTVQTGVSTATNSAGSVALAGGVSIATTINNGFKSTLNLHSIMETEMGYVKTAVDNGISAAKTAAENGAEEIVGAFKNGINVGSPGDIARTMEQEMNYTTGFILGAYGMLKNSAYNAARTIVEAFGTPSLSVDSFNGFNSEDIDTLRTTVSAAPKGDNAKTVIIEIHEGAIPVDARNRTTKEAKALLISALEGIDNITDIDVDV